MAVTSTVSSRFIVAPRVIEKKNLMKIGSQK